MFGKKKNQPSAIRHAKFATLIAHDVRVEGDLEFSEGVRLDGHVNGNISTKPGCQTLLVLSNLGSVTGNVHGHDVVINGRIVGDVVADRFVELQANAHVTGNIDYLQLRMDAGATVDGKLTRREPAPAPASAAAKAGAKDASKAETSAQEHAR